MAVDPVAQARSIIEAALRGVEEETRRLERALAGFGDGGPRASAPAGTPRRRRRRRAKPGQRREQFLAAVKEQPGITVAKAAKKLGISPPNALYALAKRLVKEGEIIKAGAGYAPKKATAAPAAAKSQKPKAKAKRGAKKAKRGARGRRSAAGRS
jgi:transposase-like protein